MSKPYLYFIKRKRREGIHSRQSMFLTKLLLGLAASAFHVLQQGCGFHMP